MMATEAQTLVQWPKDVILFTGAYLLPAIAAAIWTRNGEFIFYSVVMLALIGAVAMVHRRCRLSRAVLWGLSAWGLAHMVGGLIPVPASWPTHGPNKVVYSWWLIPGYGALGAAVATIVVESLAFALLWRPVNLFTTGRWRYARR